MKPPQTPLLSLLLLILFFSTTLSSSCPPWNYDISSPYGPAQWGNLCSEYSNCLQGLQQSPIDLVDDLEVQGELSNLVYTYKQLNNFTLINTRYTIEGTDLGKQNTLSFVGLHTYTLTEFHFHAPSEHRINGQQFALEIHYLHSDDEGNLATLSLLYNNSVGGSGTNWFLQLIAVLIPDVPRDNSTTTVPTLDIASQVNVGDGFYHYEGSTTTPPCTEGVQWFVAMNPIPVDPSVLSQFTAVLSNSRPLQPRNDRTIGHYVPGTSSAINTWVYAIGIAGLGTLGVLILLGVVRYVYRVYNAKRYENQQELIGFLGSTNNETL